MIRLAFPSLSFIMAADENLWGADGKNSNLHASCSPPLKRQAYYKRFPKTAADWIANRFVELNASASAISQSLGHLFGSTAGGHFHRPLGQEASYFFRFRDDYQSANQLPLITAGELNAGSFSCWLRSLCQSITIVPSSSSFLVHIAIKVLHLLGGPLSFSIYVQWTSGPVTKINGSRLNIHCMRLQLGRLN